LDGLPLAVELAAARVRALAPEAMVARLGSRLRLLTSGPRDADERQRTLRAAIQWSYDLLPPNEQTLFGSLSVFVGGCRLEDAEAVCDSGGALGMDVLEGVASLVDKSLLRRRVDPDGESRYGMLETIREFAADACANSARAALHEQHARHFAAVAEQFDHAARVDAQEGSLERLDPEIGNLRAALEWAQEAGDREIAVRLVTALTRYWATRGYISEGLGRVEEAVAGIDAPPQTMIGLCLLRHLAGYDARAGLADARRALVALEELGDDVAQAQAWHLVGRLHASGLSEISAGEQAGARARVRRARTTARGTGRDHGLADGHGDVRPAADERGDQPLRSFSPQRRRRPARTRLRVDRDRRLTGDAGRVRGGPLAPRRRKTDLPRPRPQRLGGEHGAEAFYVHMLAGDPAAAEEQLRASCDALEAMGERGFLSTVAGFRAHALYALGDGDAAEEASRQSERFAASDDFFSQVLWRSARAKVYAQRGAFEAALALAHEAVALSDGTENENLNMRGDMLSDLGEVLRLSGSPHEAAAAFADAARRYEAKENLVSLQRARREADALVHPARSISS